MKLLFLILILSTQAFSYEKSVQASGARDSHAVLPGDIEGAFCLPVIDEALTKNDIYMKLRALGYDISRVIRDTRFSLAHIRDLYKAVLLMPKWLKLGSSYDSNNVIINVDDSRSAVAWMKKSTLTINPLEWNKFVADMRTSIIFHELSHLLGYKLSRIDDSLAWQNIDGGWKASSYRRGGSIYAGRPLNSLALVSDYAATNPAEDFAESLSSYRIKPHVLKSLSPKRYNFIKDIIFLGKEYLDESSCNLSLNEIIDTEKTKEIFKSKLSSSSRHFDRAYTYALRKRGQNPKRLEYIYKLAAMRSAINSQDRGRNTPRDRFVIISKLRVYLKTLNTIEMLNEFHNNHSNSLLSKLLRNSRRY